MERIKFVKHDYRSLGFIDAQKVILDIPLTRRNVLIGVGTLGGLSLATILGINRFLNQYDHNETPPINYPIQKSSDLMYYNKGLGTVESIKEDLKNRNLSDLVLHDDLLLHLIKSNNLTQDQKDKLIADYKQLAPDLMDFYKLTYENMGFNNPMRRVYKKKADALYWLLHQKEPTIEHLI